MRRGRAGTGRRLSSGGGAAAGTARRYRLSRGSVTGRGASVRGGRGHTRYWGMIRHDWLVTAPVLGRDAQQTAVARTMARAIVNDRDV
jgi:hypothetical protein